MSKLGFDQEALKASLEQAAIAAGWPDPQVTALVRLAGGASKETWSFDLLNQDGSSTPMVLRLQPFESRFSSEGVASLATEAAILRIFSHRDVPVPEVFFEMPPDNGMGQGYVMSRIIGETVGTRILSDRSLAVVRERMARDCGRILARIHAVPRDCLPSLVERGTRQALAELCQRWEALNQARPVFEFAIRWLEDNMQAESTRTLVHGDFRNGNLVVGPDGIRSVLDWELTHIGAPVSDLAWICVTSWRFQRPEKPVGGFGSREELLNGYREAGGVAIDWHDLHAWEVFQTLRWGVMCAEVGRRFMDGIRTVEGGMIARRISETEFDLLRLLLPEQEVWHAG